MAAYKQVSILIKMICISQNSMCTIHMCDEGSLALTILSTNRTILGHFMHPVVFAQVFSPRIRLPTYITFKILLPSMNNHVPGKTVF